MKEYTIYEKITNTYLVKAKDKKEAMANLINWNCKEIDSEKDYKIEESA